MSRGVEKTIRFMSRCVVHQSLPRGRQSQAVNRHVRTPNVEVTAQILPDHMEKGNRLERGCVISMLS